MGARPNVCLVQHPLMLKSCLDLSLIFFSQTVLFSLFPFSPFLFLNMYIYKISPTTAHTQPTHRYLKCIDRFFNNYISCFVTGANVKFLLLHQPTAPTSTSSSRSSTAIGANPTSPATEEAIKMFFTEVYDNWVKAVMNPFYKANAEVTSPVFRQRVAAAGRKYL